MKKPLFTIFLSIIAVFTFIFTSINTKAAVVSCPNDPSITYNTDYMYYVSPCNNPYNNTNNYLKNNIFPSCGDYVDCNHIWLNNWYNQSDYNDNNYNLCPNGQKISIYQVCPSDSIYQNYSYYYNQNQYINYTQYYQNNFDYNQYYQNLYNGYYNQTLPKNCSTGYNGGVFCW